MSEINWKDGCWVTTIFLVKDDGKVLLTWNGRLDTWIPVGGHIEPGDNPDDAIIREVKEEIPGFEFEFIPSPHYEGNNAVKVIKPYRVQIERVPHHNSHINIVFFGKCTKWVNLEENDEGDKLRWFSEEELEKEEMLESVKKLALIAIDSVIKK